MLARITANPFPKLLGAGREEKGERQLVAGVARPRFVTLNYLADFLRKLDGLTPILVPT
jgi:hypothetical protein